MVKLIKSFDEIFEKVIEQSIMPRLQIWMVDILIHCYNLLLSKDGSVAKAIIEIYVYMGILDLRKVLPVLGENYGV
jgi:hypothetical protein